MRFAEGSRVSFAKDARGRLLDVDRRGARVLLEPGEVSVKGGEQFQAVLEGNGASQQRINPIGASKTALGSDSEAVYRGWQWAVG